MMKIFMKHLLLLALVFVTATASASNLPQQQSNTGITKEYRAAVKALLDVMGFEKNMRDNLLKIYFQLGLEGDYVNAIVDEMVSKMPDKMVEIYSKYFTLDEIKQLTKNNQNEVQRKLKALQPQINQDFINVGKSFASGEQSPLAGIVVPQDFDEAMKEYFAVSGFEKQKEQMMALLEQSYGMKSGSLDEISNALPDMMVKIYSKYLTTSEVKQLTAIAKTPISQKNIEKTPEITQDTMQAAQQIVMEYFQKFLQ